MYRNTRDFFSFNNIAIYHDAVNFFEYSFQFSIQSSLVIWRGLVPVAIAVTKICGHSSYLYKME